MTKFCTKCGKKLAEGQKCTCEKIKRETKTFAGRTPYRAGEGLCDAGRSVG